MNTGEKNQSFFLFSVSLYFDEF